MEPVGQRSRRNGGAVTRSAQPANPVLTRAPRSVSIPAGVGRICGAAQTALPDVPGLGREREWLAGWRIHALGPGGAVGCHATAPAPLKRLGNIDKAPPQLTPRVGDGPAVIP